MAEEGGLHPPGVPPETVDEFNQGVTESWLAPPMNLETDQHFEGSEAHWGPGFSQAPQGVPQGYSAPVAISAAAINAEDDATVEARSHQQRALEGLEAGKTVERAIAHGSIARRWRRAPVQGQQGTLSAPRANRATGSMGSTDGFDRGPEVHPQAQVDYEAALGRALKRGTKKGSSKIYTKVEGGLSGSRQALDSQRLAQRRCNRPCADQPLQPLHPNKCLLRGCQSGTSLAKPWKMAIK